MHWYIFVGLPSKHTIFMDDTQIALVNIETRKIQKKNDAHISFHGNRRQNTFNSIQAEYNTVANRAAHTSESRSSIHLLIRDTERLQRRSTILYPPYNLILLYLVWLLCTNNSIIPLPIYIHDDCVSPDFWGAAHHQRVSFPKYPCMF